MAGQSPAQRAVAPGSRERVLDAAGELLQRRGYAGTGLSEILARADAPKGSLYFHFPGGKEQLAAEALMLSGQRFSQAMAAVVSAAASAGEAVHAVIKILSAGLSATDYQVGCPIATTALETAHSSEPIRTAADGAFTEWTEILTERLQRDGRATDAAHAQAVLVLSAIEGALILARAARSTTALETVGDELARSLDR